MNKRLAETLVPTPCKIVIRLPGVGGYRSSQDLNGFPITYGNLVTEGRYDEKNERPKSRVLSFSLDTFIVEDLV